jgi:hypothetical protein
VIGLSALAIAPANAQHPMDEEGAGSHFTHRHHNRHQGRPCRERAHGLHRSLRACHGYVVNHAGKEHRLSHSMLAKYGGLVSADGTSLRQAAATSSVRWRTFWQDGMTLPGPDVLYQEKHDGMGFYDGTHVWIDPPGGGPVGDHSCYATHEIGFDVSLESCSEKFRFTDANTPYIQFWDYWKVGIIWARFPLSTHYNMHVNLHASGRLTFWFDDDKLGDDLP